MHEIERELIEVSKIKLRKKYDNRQDYLGSILESANKIDDDAFNGLTDEATDWYNRAVQAYNGKKDLPDFDEEGEGDETEEEAVEEASKDAEPDEDQEEAESEEDDEPEDDEDEAVEDSGDGPESVEASPAKEVKANKKAPAKAPPREKPAKATKSPAAKTKSSKNVEEDVVLDKWNCMPGSKNAQAIAMFEKGATAAEVKEEIGGTYYNLLKKLEQAGHTLEKSGHIITLTHRDANKSSPVKGKKK